MRSAVVALGVLGLGFAALAACGSDSDTANPPPVSPEAGSEAGPPVQQFQPDDSGTPDTGNGSSSSGDSGPTTPTCPTYQTLCDGKCVPTTDDAEHCGGCATKCTGAQACSAGKCSDTCQVGLEICANRCVDKQTDNAHCGTCGHACGAGEGCVAGACVTAIPVGTAPAKCAGGGPAIVNDDDKGGCLGNLAQKTFRWSLCSCTDATFSAAMTADAYDSTKGPYAPGSTGGGIGANNDEKASSTVTIGGDLWAHGTGGLAPTGKHVIRNDLRLNGPLDPKAAFSVENDAFVNGDVTTSATIDITHELTVPADKTIAASGITAGKTTRAPVSFSEPCDCSASQLVPTAAIVAAHVSKNDNAAIGLDAGALKSLTKATRLDLPCGEFYLTGIDTNVPVTVAVHGRTALYIEGDIKTTSPIAFAVDPIGELDIFVTGTLNSSASLHIGSPNYPALTRTYVGTKSSVDLSADVRIGGNLYIGTGSIAWSATSDLYGAVFANAFVASAPTNLHYDRAVLQAGNSCPGATVGTDAGPACTSCRDCNNQACNGGKCGACTQDSDCCAPLQCNDSGFCVPAVR